MIEQSDDEAIIIIDPSPEELAKIEQEYLEETRRFINSTLPFRLEHWYPYVEQFTFKTCSTYLTAFEAYSMTRTYNLAKCEEEHYKALEVFKKRIDTLIATQFPNGCFVKLSTRSAKDYCWDFTQPEYFQWMVQRLASKIKEIGLDKIEQHRPLTAAEGNTLYQVLCNESRRRVLVRNGDELIKIFSKSDRVNIDICNLLVCQNYLERQFKAGNYQKADMKLIDICLREWVDFEWGNQFRCFYNDLKVTAITAYEQDCLFEHWLGKQDTIRQRVLDYFQKVKPHLQKANLNRGVLDVAFSNDLSQMYLIEINTFDENSRASLFSWKNERHILEEGDGEVRIVKECKPNILEKIGRIMGMMDKGSRQVVSKAIQICNSKAYLE